MSEPSLRRSTSDLKSSVLLLLSELAEDGVLPSLDDKRAPVPPPAPPSKATPQPNSSSANATTPTTSSTPSSSSSLFSMMSSSTGLAEPAAKRTKLGDSDGHGSLFADTALGKQGIMSSDGLSSYAQATETNRPAPSSTSWLLSSDQDADEAAFGVAVAAAQGSGQAASGASAGAGAGAAGAFAASSSSSSAVDGVSSVANAAALSRAAHFISEATADALIGNFHKVLDRADEALREAAVTHAELRLPLDKKVLEAVTGELSDIDAQLETVKNKLESKLDERLVKPQHIGRFRDVAERLDVQRAQLKVYTEELDFIVQYGRDDPPPYLRLVIAQQPFPQTIHHGKPLPGDLTVRLLLGAKTRTASIGSATCELILDAPDKARDKPNLVGNVLPLDAQERSANFASTLMCPKGTRLHEASFKFVVPTEVVEGATATRTLKVESAQTAKFIVTTHENQWAAAEGLLFVSHLFAASPSVPWGRFANAFHELFLRGTRQTLHMPMRPLCPDDFIYLYERMGSKDEVKKGEWEQLWHWLQEGLRNIRYGKHLCDMWVQGLILGFATRDKAVALLEGHPPGTFLVRMSDSTPGQFVVSFVKSEDVGNVVRHYMVKPDDTSAKKSLAEFLRGHAPLVYVLQVTIDQSTSLRNLNRQHKDQVLRKFYGKEAPFKPPASYQSTI